MKRENNSFELSTFGDKNTEQFQSSLLGSRNAKLGRWIIKRLTEKKERNVFVCPFSDFCDLLEREDWRAFLTDLIGIRNDPRRTGIFILTASVFAEDTRDYLLTSSVFNEMSVNGAQNGLCPQINQCREAKKENLYGTLAHSLGEACVFLNQFTYERIYAMLLQHTIRNGTDLYAQLPEMAEYLTSVLNSVDFRLGQVFPELIDFNGITEYQTLYQKLDIASLQNEIRKKHSDQNSGEHFCSEYPPIYYRDERINNCLRLKLPNGISDEHSSSVLFNIKRELLSVINREVNQNILKKISELCLWFHPGNIYPEDGEIVRMLTDYLDFYIKWLYTETGSPEEKKILSIADLIGTCLTTTFQCTQDKREYKRLPPENDRTNLMQSKANQLFSLIATEERSLLHLKDLIQSSMLDLSLISTSKKASELENRLNTAMEQEYDVTGKTDDVSEPVMPLPQPPDSEIPAVQRDLFDDNFEIRADMYSFLPNKN